MDKYIKKKLSPRKITGMIIVSVIIIASLICLWHTNLRKLHAIEKEIDLLPSLSFEADELDGLKAQLEKWEKLPVSDDAKAVLFGRLSYIASQKGDRLEYYTNFGKGQYYLDSGKDTEAAVNSYCDILFYTYLAEGNVALARETLDRIDTMIAENGLENEQLLSIVNRHHSAIAYYEGNPDEAVEYAEKARTVLTDTTPNYYETYVMGAAMLKAKALIDKGDFDGAKAVLDEYRDSSLFSATFYPSTLNNVCLIPFWQAQAYLYAEEGNEEGMLECLHSVVTKSSEFDYEYYGFDTLQRLDEKWTLSDGAKGIINDLEKQLNQSYISRKSERFTSLAAAVINSNYEAEKTRVENRERNIRQGIIFVVFLISILILILIIRLVTRNGYIDALTGIGNRRAYDSTIAGFESAHSDYSVIMMDIDDFKKINDTYGHDEGDKVLQAIGRILRAIRKKGQIIPFRYGGEEFVVLTRGLLVDGTNELAELIRSEIEKQNICGHRITVSIGFAYSRDINREERDTVLKLADKNMYVAKQSGKNCVVGE